VYIYTCILEAVNVCTYILEDCATVNVWLWLFIHHLLGRLGSWWYRLARIRLIGRWWIARINTYIKPHRRRSTRLGRRLVGIFVISFRSRIGRRRGHSSRVRLLWSGLAWNWLNWLYRLCWYYHITLWWMGSSGRNGSSSDQGGSC
jgi:hypothetical protein